MASYNPLAFDWNSFLESRIAAPQPRTLEDVPNQLLHGWLSRGNVNNGSNGNAPVPAPRNNPAGPQGPKNGGGPRNGNRNGGQGGGRYGAVGDYPGIPRKRASRIVKGQVRELMRGLRHERSQVRQNQANDIRDVNTYTANTLSGLDNIQQQTLAYLAQQQAAAQAAQQATQQQVANTDAALQQQMQQTNQQLQGAAQAELARLGIAQAGDLTDWNAQQAAAMNAAQQQAAFNQQNLAMQNGAAQQLAAMMNAGLVGSLNSSRISALQNQQLALNEIGDDSRGQIADIMAEMRNARKGKRDAINELLEQMVAGDYDRWANTKDMNFQHWLSRQGLALDRAQFAYGQRMDRLGLLQDAANAQQLASGYQNMFTGPNPYRSLGRGSRRGPSVPGRRNNGGKRIPRKFEDRDAYPGPAF